MPTDTPKELYPIDDGLFKPEKTDVPTGYDLSQLLSNSFREKDWVAAFSKVASNIMYEMAANQRMALAVSRDPQYLVREFKIRLAKMLGLEYRSDKMTDDDYDRLINFLGLYNRQKGPDHFIKFLGFIKDAYLQLWRLWTKDYVNFQLKLSNGQTTIFEDGLWYPTSHVAVTYDQFRTDLSVFEENDVYNLFYQLAPINLVLLFVAGLIYGDPLELFIGIQAVDIERIQTYMKSNIPRSYGKYVLLPCELTASGYSFNQAGLVPSLSPVIFTGGNLSTGTMLKTLSDTTLDSIGLKQGFIGLMASSLGSVTLTATGNFVSTDFVLGEDALGDNPL